MGSMVQWLGYCEVQYGSSSWTDLSSCTPVKPAHVGGMPKVRVDAISDQHMAAGFLVLHNVIEVGASR